MLAFSLDSSMGLYSEVEFAPYLIAFELCLIQNDEFWKYLHVFDDDWTLLKTSYHLLKFKSF